MLAASEIRIGVVIAGDSILDDVVVNHFVKAAGLNPSNISIKHVPNDTQVVMGVLFFAEYTVSAVFMPYCLASSFFARTIPWRSSVLPHTAIGTPIYPRLSAVSTEAKKELQSQCKITRLPVLFIAHYLF